jgi:hypothetical protein
MTEPESHTARKLLLSKETLRGLDHVALPDPELERARGGVSTTGCIAVSLKDCVMTLTCWCLSEPC